MAKITDLLATTALTGDEYLPIVQGGITKRSTMAAFRAMIVPFLQAWYKGDKGEPGAAGNVAAFLAQLRAAPTTAVTMLFGGLPWTWTPGAVPDGVARIASDTDTTGAWVRHDARLLPFDGRSTGEKLAELVYVTDGRFGAKGDGVTDDTAAINRALAFGGRIVFPRGTYKISGRLLVTVALTDVVMEAGCKIVGNPWRYNGSQNPFGGLFVITAPHCSIRGAGKGASIIQLAGGSEANGIVFLHCDGGYVGHLTIDGAKDGVTAMHDDTFGTGVAIFNVRVSNPSNTPARATFDHVEARNFIHYGGQVWGDLSELSVLDCDFDSNGKASDPLSVGCGFAITFGVRNFLMSRTRLRGNKRHGVLQSSAGLSSYNLRFTDNEASGNGGWGLSFTEELNFFCKKGVGTNGIFTKGNTIKNNGAGGKRFGTYDGVGFIQNVSSDDDVLDNGGHGLLIQANADPDAGVVRVAINDALIGHPIGIGIGIGIGDTVKWNGLRIAGNDVDISNSGLSRLVSNARGFGGDVTVAPAITFPPNGDSIRLVGDGEVETITPDPGRIMTIIFGGAPTIATTGNIKMQTPFQGGGNATLMLVSSESAWFEISRSINA